ncbi:MAG: ABC transporter ATP-binding protein [Calothrix sp. C42_A2020_038]|nr:ABC transporter ATP-binding protein [Calothrix sp. C42_A2020_038]
MKEKSILISLSQFVKPHKHLAIASLILAATLSVLEVLSTALILPLTQALSGEQEPNSIQSSFLKPLLTFHTYFPPKWQLLAIILALLCLTIIKNLVAYLSSISIYDFMLRSGTLLRRKCVERILELEVVFYTRKNLGELLSHINEQAQRSELLFSLYLEVIRNLLIIGFLLCFLITLSPVLTIIALVSLSIVFLPLRALNRNLQVYSRKAAVTIEAFSTLVTEIITGIRVVKSFHAEARELKRAEESLQNRYNADLKGYKYYSASAPVTETVGISVLLVIILIGANFFLTSTNSTLPILLTFTVTLMRILPKVTILNSFRSQIYLFRGYYEEVQGFLHNTDNLKLPDGQKSYSGLNSELIFKNVTFTFPNNTAPTLHNISLEIIKGKTTAIVGSSGSGKSTLVDLIMRFYDPEQGSICVDGIDIRYLQIGSFRSAIAMVSQDTFLFDVSVRENIRYGRPNATEAEVITAAKQAYAFDFIQDLPQGLDTIVGSRGARLSGGQRQRIAIARAILCNPDILILDEATSALDSNSERIVQQAIEAVSKDRTVIVIAHRLSTIEKADKIIVLQDGCLLEQGTHQELLESRRVYYSLYQSQKLSTSAMDLPTPLTREA